MVTIQTVALFLNQISFESSLEKYICIGLFYL